MMIESVNNELIKKYAKLNDKKYRDLEDLFIVEGKHLVEEALKTQNVEQIFSLDGSMGICVSENVMRKLSTLKTIPSVLAVVKKPKNNQLSDKILYLDNIQDPGNLGTIIRSVAAFGDYTIVASKNTVDVYNPKTIRGTEGMFFLVNYVIMDFLDLYKLIPDYQIIATNVKTGVNLRDIKPSSKHVIIVGNEGNGVSDDLLKRADTNLLIPMNKQCESLNVAIATSIILYELSS